MLIFCSARSQTFEDVDGDGITDSWVTMTPSRTQTGLDDTCGREYTGSYSFTATAGNYYVVQGKQNNVWTLLNAFYPTTTQSTSLSWCEDENCNHYTDYRLITLGKASMTSFTTKHAASGASDARTTIGLSETVTVQLSPSMSASWSIVSGGGTLSSSTGTQPSLFAPGNTGTVTVRATYGSYSQYVEKTFTVVAPTTASYSFREDVGYTSGTSRIGAKSRWNVLVSPNTVSFAYADLREDQRTAYNFTWPDGTADTTTTGTPDFEVGEDNTTIDTYETGTVVKDRLKDSGGVYQDFNWVWPYTLNWVDGSTYHQFPSGTTITGNHRYRASDFKAQVEVVGPNATITAGWMGPWN